MRVCDCSRVSNNRTSLIKRTYWKTRFHMACKEGQFDVVELMLNEQFKTFRMNLNAQHMNGMSPFDSAVHVRLLDILEYVFFCQF